MIEATVLAVGDIILGEPDPDRFFEPSLTTLRGGDAVIAHVETPYTLEGIQMPVDVPSGAGDPARLSALPTAGFNLATIAGNHAYDQGLPGVRDTIASLRALGIQTAGTGLTIGEARTPAFLERKGIRFGLLAYNAVGPRASWAGPAKAGAAYVDVMTHYEQE